jgi:hypothetical protein
MSEQWKKSIFHQITSGEFSAIGLVIKQDELGHYDQGRNLRSSDTSEKNVLKLIMTQA